MKVQNEKKLLEIKNLSVDFENHEKTVHAVRNVSLSLNHGEFAALVGESGSGKTMTALSIMNLLPENALIKSGEILFNDKNIFLLNAKERRNLSGKELSMIFQEPQVSLDPLMKVGKQIAESAMCHGSNKNDAYRKTFELLEKTGFKDTERIFNSYPHELSGGMKQRIMIASALINKPELLIADEPTTALDASIQTEILNIITNLNRENNTSLLLISHDLSVVSKFCTKIYVMLNGEIIESGNTDEVISKPVHPYTKALINAIPKPENKNKRLETFSKVFINEEAGENK